MKNCVVIWLLCSLIIALLTACTGTGSEPAKQKTYTSFVGTVTEVISEIDGYTVTLLSENKRDSIKAVLSIPNLGLDNDFNFKLVKIGNHLKIYGDSYYVGEDVFMSAKKVLSYMPIYSATPKMPEEQKIKCELVGGNIEKAGKTQFETCIQSYSDGGEVCSDNDECFGLCIGEKNKKMKIGQRSLGLCEFKDHIFGCKNLISNGKFEGKMCID